MKFGIDGSFLIKDTRGMGRVTRALTKIMLDSSAHEYYFLMPFHRKDEQKIAKLFLPKQIEFVSPSDEMVKTFDAVWFPWNRVDFFPSCRRIVSVYDLAPYRFPSLNKQDGYRDRRRLKQACEAADTIITCSEFSKSEIMTFLDIPADKITVIGLGVDEEFSPSSGDGEKSFLNFFSDGMPYILFVGSVEKRKNLEVLLYGFDEAKRKYNIPHKLLIAGSAPEGLLKSGKRNKNLLESLTGYFVKKKADRIVSVFGKLEFKEQINWLGEVADRDLVNLYSFASLFVFPSLYEGFGIPLLEAFASGVPALISDIPVFREIAGDAADFFDCRDKSDLALKMSGILLDPDFASELKRRAYERVKLFDWKMSASEHLRVLEAMN